MVAFNVDEQTLDQFCNGNADHRMTHDKVIAICPSKQTVTLSLTAGFSFARPVLYLSTEGSSHAAATMEGATLAPALAMVSKGRDDSFTSPVERIFAFVNGPAGKENPQRQGFNNALSGEGGPLNVLGGIPTIATDYSPLWDLNQGVWTQEAIDKGYRSRLIDEFTILGFVQRGYITGPGKSRFGSVGVVVNCPVVFRFL